MLRVDFSVHKSSTGGRAGEARWRRPFDGGARLQYQRRRKGEWVGWAKWPHGPDEAGLVREERWTRLQESLGHLKNRKAFGISFQQL
jgi:hypothetical protein